MKHSTVHGSNYICRSLAIKSLTMALMYLAVGIFSTASAHNVWCHCGKSNVKDAVEFFHEAGEVYEALSDVMATWHMANSPLESGVIAEFEHVSTGSPLSPEKFKETLAALEMLSLKLNVLEKELIDLSKLSSPDSMVPEFNVAVSNLLSEQHGIPRLSKTGVRYADIAGQKSDSKPIRGVDGIVQAQLDDLLILKGVLAETISGLRESIPLAEKGEFAKVMLSGRSGFGDKMPQLTDMIYAYQSLYVRTCMSTIQATMQIYPKGFEWLGAKDK